MNDEKIWLETEDGQKLFIIKTEKCDMQKELTETIDYLQQELQRKDNIINEIKKELTKDYNTYVCKNKSYGKTFKAGAETYKEHLLYKIKEFEGKYE